MIMNALLMKYVGVMVTVGGGEEGRRGYFRVQREVSENAEAGETLGGLVVRWTRGRLERVLGMVIRKEGEEWGYMRVADDS